jgi:hypothetical protein
MEEWRLCLAAAAAAVWAMPWPMRPRPMQPILSKWVMGVEEMDRREEVLVVLMALEIVLEVMMDREKVIDEIMMVILMVKDV